MLKRITIAVIVAILTATGVIIPDRYVDSFVSLFMPRAHASQAIAWETLPYQFKCDWYCSCPSTPPIRFASTVGALRPPSGHFSSDRLSPISSDNVASSKLV